MRKAKDLSIGAVVQVPTYEFAPFRSGWNGWLFSAGIIKAHGKSKKTGLPIVKVEYPARGYKQKRYYANGTEAPMKADTIEKWFFVSAVFEFSLKSCKEEIKFPREHWCYKSYLEDTEFLIDKGILQDYKE